MIEQTTIALSRGYVLDPEGQVAPMSEVVLKAPTLDSLLADEAERTGKPLADEKASILRRATKPCGAIISRELLGKLSYHDWRKVSEADAVFFGLSADSKTPTQELSAE